MVFEEKDLVENLRQDKTRKLAFHILVKEYQERLYWHIRKIILNHDDTDDVLQNTFLKAWHGIENFKGESSLFTWLYKIATNEAITFLNKKKKRNIFSPQEEIHNYLINSIESEEHFSGDKIQKKLQEAIIRLPEKQRLVFNMKYFDEMKYQEISEILETSVGALKASYHHAVKKIEEYLKNSE